MNMQDNFFPPTHKRVGLNKSMFGDKFSKKNEHAGSLFWVIRVNNPDKAETTSSKTKS